MAHDRAHHRGMGASTARFTIAAFVLFVVLTAAPLAAQAQAPVERG